ncbi:hypothetical protein AB0B10_25545 [Micromonospora arborensis]|uniref:hypothetical protein n=1 Tax=Micromonospora arborensis TaxID=2116518 RepID=UPI0033E8D2D7
MNRGPSVTTAVDLTLPQLTAWVILLARSVATYHWPNAHGLCPRCGVPNCVALRMAQQVLQRHSRPPAPILRGDTW